MSQVRSVPRLGWLIDVVLMAVLAALPWLYFWRLFAPNRADQMTVTEGDFTGNTFPLLLTVAQSLRDGVLPLWNPLAGGGQPLLAHPQAGVLYPLNWLVFPFVQGLDVSSLLAVERTIPLHIALASIGTYALARIIAGSRVAALVAALAFGYSGYLTSYPIQQLPVLRTAAWFPLATVAWWLTLERGSLFWSVCTGLVLAIAFLAGHPQTVFIEAVALVLLAIGWVVTGRLRDGPATSGWRIGGLGCLAAVVAVGVSAAQWLPTRELQALSSRTEEGYNFAAGGFSFWEVPLDLVAPGVLGGLPPYVGILTLILAAVGIIVRPNPRHAVLAFPFIGGILLSLGGNTFLFPALYVVVPGFDLFRNQERFFLITALTAALLAALGTAALLDRLDLHARARLLRFRRVLAQLLGVGLATGAALYLGHVSAEVADQGFSRWRDVIHAFFFFLFLLACSYGLIGARLAVPALHPLLPGLIPIVIAFDLFSVTADRQLVSRPVDSAFHRPAVVPILQRELDGGRMADRDLLSGNHGLSYGLSSVTSTFPLRLTRVDIARRTLPDARFLDLLNVSHLVAPRSDPAFAGPGTVENLADAAYVLFRRSTAPGAAYLVGEARPAASGEEALRIVSDPAFNLSRQVAIEGLSVPSIRGGAGTVSEFKRNWDEVALRASAPSGGFLVLADVAYPGWTARIDGREVPISRANYLLQAVELPPGEHRVTFHYEPWSFGLGVVISVVTLVIVTLIAVWSLSLSPLLRTRRSESGLG